MVVGLPVLHPGLGEGNAQRLHRPGDGHIEETAFLLQFLGQHCRAATREKPFLHTAHKDVRKLQSLRGVHRHHRNPVCGILSFAVLCSHIYAAEQRYVLKIVGQQHHWEFHVLQFGAVACSQQLFHIRIVLLLHHLLHVVQELLHVSEPGLALRAEVGLEHLHHTGFEGYGPGQFIGVFPGGAGAKGSDHCAEGRKSAYGGALEAVFRELVPGSSLEETDSLRPGCGNHGSQGGIPYGPDRFVDYPLEGFVIIVVDHELEVGHHILDLSPLEEGFSREDLVGYVGRTQFLLKGPGLRIGTVEYGEIPVGCRIRRYASLDRGCDEARLFFRGISLDKAYEFAPVALGEAFFLNPVGILLYERVRRLDYDLRAAVVLLQAEELRLRIVLRKVYYILYLSAAEGVYRLRIVAHYAYIPVLPGESAQYQVLRPVRILVLIDEYIVETGGYFLPRLDVVAEKYVHIYEYVVEVHHSAFAATDHIFRIYVRYPRRAATDVGLHLLAVLPVGGRHHEIVLGHGNPREHVFGLVETLLVEPHILDYGLDQTLGFGSVVDREVRREGERAGVAP